MKKRNRMAEQFARLHGVSVEPWMLWEGWKHWVGCETCQELGPAAPCWGYAECHGYYNGCGCQECAERDKREADLGCTYIEVPKDIGVWRCSKCLFEFVLDDCCSDPDQASMKFCPGCGSRITGIRRTGDFDSSVTARKRRSQIQFESRLGHQRTQETEA